MLTETKTMADVWVDSWSGSGFNWFANAEKNRPDTSVRRGIRGIGCIGFRARAKVFTHQPVLKITLVPGWAV